MDSTSGIPHVAHAQLVPSPPGDLTQPAMLGFGAASWIDLHRRAGSAFYLPELQQIILCGDAVNKAMWRQPDDWSYARSNTGLAFRAQLGDEYITASDGESHRRQRKLLRPAFSGPALLRHLPVLFELLCARLDELTDRAEPVDLHHELIFIYTYLLNRTLVRAPVSDQQIWQFAEYEEQLIGGLRLSGDERVAWYARPDYQSLRRVVFAHFDTLVEERLADTSRCVDGNADNLDLLISAMRRSGPLDKVEIVRDAYLMQAGGAGNTASLACCLLWKLTQQETPALEPLDQVLVALLDGDQIDAQILRSTLLLAVTQEAERCFLPTPGVLKVAQRDLTIAGFAVPAETELLHLFGMSNFMATTYPEPLQFKPERWLQGKLQRSRAFGGGQHMCLGINVAQALLMLTVLAIIPRYRLTAAAPPGRRAVVAEDDGSVTEGPVAKAMPDRLGFDVILQRR